MLPRAGFAFIFALQQTSGGIVSGGFGFWRQLLAVAGLLWVAGCAQPVPAPDAATMTRMNAQFAAGDADLNCRTLGCLLSYDRPGLKSMYDDQDWTDLAQKLLLYKEDENQSWFYLASAAEGLGHYDAAQIYYFDSLLAPLRCEDHINICDGLDLPNLIFARIEHLDQEMAASPEFAQTQALAASPTKPVTVKLVAKQGFLAAPVILNGKIPILMAVDSGSTGVNLSFGVAAVMIHEKILQKSDFLGRATVQMGNGDTVPVLIVRIKKLQVGGVVETNVLASLSPGRAPALLGQSFLQRFKSWSIDYADKTLVLQP
jgi:predicted aspartyl protease